MAEYIERDALLQDIEDSVRITSKTGMINPETRGAYKIIERIKSAAAADVVEVRHGWWKCNKPCPVCGGDRFEGLDADIWADWEPPYCPNCGAKMDGGAD